MSKRKKGWGLFDASQESNNLSDQEREAVRHAREEQEAQNQLKEQQATRLATEENLAQQRPEEQEAAKMAQEEFDANKRLKEQEGAKLAEQEAQKRQKEQEAARIAQEEFDANKRLKEQKGARLAEQEAQQQQKEQEAARIAQEKFYANERLKEQEDADLEEKAKAANPIPAETRQTVQTTAGGSSEQSKSSPNRKRGSILLLLLFLFSIGGCLISCKFFGYCLKTPITKKEIAQYTAWYHDSDGDGFGDKATKVTAFTRPKGYISDNTDPDDNDPCSPDVTNCETIDEKVRATLEHYYMLIENKRYDELTTVLKFPLLTYSNSDQIENESESYLKMNSIDTFENKIVRIGKTKFDRIASDGDSVFTVSFDLKYNYLKDYDPTVTYSFLVNSVFKLDKGTNGILISHMDKVGRQCLSEGKACISNTGKSGTINDQCKCVETKQVQPANNDASSSSGSNRSTSTSVEKTGAAIQGQSKSSTPTAHTDDCPTRSGSLSSGCPKLTISTIEQVSVIGMKNELQASLEDPKPGDSYQWTAKAHLESPKASSTFISHPYVEKITVQLQVTNSSDGFQSSKTHKVHFTISEAQLKQYLVDLAEFGNYANAGRTAEIDKKKNAADDFFENSLESETIKLKKSRRGVLVNGKSFRDLRFELLTPKSDVKSKINFTNLQVSDIQYDKVSGRISSFKYSF